MASSKGVCLGRVVIVAWLVLCSLPALAADRSISGAKLLLRRAPNGSEKLIFVSKDPGFLFAAIGGADDPSAAVGGATIELFSPAEPSGGAAVAPPVAGTPGWTARDAATDVYRFANRSAPDAFSAVRSVVLKQGHTLKFVGRRAGLALAGPQGAVGVRVTTGTLRNCVLFGPSTVRKDVAGMFSARDAIAAGLPDCDNGSLGGTTTTTSTSTSTSTTLPVCGNGVIEGSEKCDGAALGECNFPAGACGPPGYSTACQCCTYGGPNSALLPCCDPGATFYPGPDFSGFCVSPRCDPPFTCGVGQCQPDHSCCSPNGGACVVEVPTGFATFACCAGLECRGLGPPLGQVENCCVGDQRTCTTDQECCTGHCTGGVCETCRSAGASCSNPAECCFPSCSGGACGACQAAGAPCLADAHCCSRLCEPTTLTCFGGCGGTGAACTSGADCCYGSCTGGTCDCQPAGGGCVTNSICCSGSCDLSGSHTCNP